MYHRQFTLTSVRIIQSACLYKQSTGNCIHDLTINLSLIHSGRKTLSSFPCLLTNNTSTTAFDKNYILTHSLFNNSNTSRYKIFRNALAGGLSLLAASLLFGGNIVKAEATASKKLDSQQLLEKADDLYNQAKYEELHALLLLHKEDKDDEVLWRLGRATYELSKLPNTAASARVVLQKEALATVEAALAINPENFAVHKWISILLDDVSAAEGNKQRILQSFRLKEHMEKACELKPTDGTSWYLLGMWHYNIADIPWYQRKVAAVIFATPPESSYDKALTIFLHAQRVEPNFYSQNFLMIGKCYLKLGEKELAQIFLKLAINYRNKAAETEYDRDAKKEATKLMAGL